MRRYLATLLLALTTLITFGYRRVFLVLTQSCPIGIYLSSDAEIERGSYVALCLTDELSELALERGYVRPGVLCGRKHAALIKPIRALPGDVVEVSEAGVTVNGVLLEHSATSPTDRQGRSLQHVGFGRYVVGPGEFWAVSSYNSGSWDSRYFGPIKCEQVLTVIVPWWVYG